MTVWVLSHEYGHGYTVDGVFASEELAGEKRARLQSEWPEEEWVHWSIEQHDLLAPWDCKPPKVPVLPQDAESRIAPTDIRYCRHCGGRRTL